MMCTLITNAISAYNLNNYKTVYINIKKKKLLKKTKLKKNHLRIVLKALVKNKKKKKRFLKINYKKKFIRRKYKRWRKMRIKVNKKVALTQLRSLFYLYGRLLKFKVRKKYKRRLKRFLIGPSRLRFKIKGRRERSRYVARRILLKTPFMRRFAFIRLPRLFFFWFIILYNDLYFYLSKIVWNNWFKFLYSSFGFNEFSKLFYKTIALYKLNYNLSSFVLNNNFVFFNNYNLNAFLNSRLFYALGSYSYFFLNGLFFYDLKYISLSSKLYVNLYIRKLRFTKKNVNLKRFFVYKV